MIGGGNDAILYRNCGVHLELYNQSWLEWTARSSTIVLHCFPWPVGPVTKGYIGKRWPSFLHHKQVGREQRMGSDLQNVVFIFSSDREAITITASVHVQQREGIVPFCVPTQLLSWGNLK